MIMIYTFVVIDSTRVCYHSMNNEMHGCLYIFDRTSVSWRILGNNVRAINSWQCEWVYSLNTCATLQTYREYHFVVMRHCLAISQGLTNSFTFFLFVGVTQLLWHRVAWEPSRVFQNFITMKWQSNLSNAILPPQISFKAVHVYL